MSDTFALDNAVSVPLVLGPQGAIPTPVATLNQTLLTNAQSLAPGLTATLPGSLVEDMASTATGALVLIDQARVDAVNSVTPQGANAFVLAALGQQFGIPQGVPTNTSVYVVISGTAGYGITPGFIVSDGTYQYVVQDGGVIDTAGNTQQLFCVASQSGTWAVPAGSVTQIVSSVASGYSLTVTNPQAGTPAISAETVDSYRSRVLLAGQASATGTASFLKTLLYAVPGVQQQLVAVRQVTGGWEVICGGGDAYQVAGAIYTAVPNLSSIVGSTTTARNVSASIFVNPDTYNITFVNPPQQVVTVTATWNTTLTNFTGAAQVNQLAAPAIQSYVNSIYVGQPINLLDMTAVFQNAVASVLAVSNLTTLTFVVTINGTTTPPDAGTSIVVGDPESYFYVSPSGVTVVQG
ncbi:MAG: hypothetical protein B7X10_00250 [Burkholderiales bacterium 21-58-4]|nr:MAG: hypothetical protein B7X10_00250 [Burkholderiales bacterium 21-58-4]